MAEELFDAEQDKTPVAEVESAKRAPRASDGLVKMYLGRDNLRVHPSCVEEHKSLGWAEA